MLQGRLKCAVPRCQLLLLLLLHRCWLLSRLCPAQAGHREAGEDAEVAEDHPLAQQRRGVGRLHNLLGLSLLTLDLKQENGFTMSGFSRQSVTNLFVLDCVKVNFTDPVDCLLVLESDKAKAAMPLGLLVH